MAQENYIKQIEQKVLDLEQEKEQLLKLVSHDVKSPFNKLYALSNLLQLVSDNLDKEQLDYLIRMEWVIKEGLTVVRNLMDLRAIENDSIELNLEDLSFGGILQEIIHGYSKQTKAKNIDIELKTNEVTIRSDKRALERVLDNLVSNAVKFTPKSEIISIGLFEEGGLVQLQVSSKSGSIPKEETNRLFKRSSPLFTRPTHGESALGNGLFIAQNYATALGSIIQFNQENSIITFTLKMPKLAS